MGLEDEDLDEEEEVVGFMQGFMSETLDEYAAECCGGHTSDGHDVVSEACLVLSSSEPDIMECIDEDEEHGGEPAERAQPLRPFSIAGRSCPPRRRIVVRDAVTPPRRPVAMPDSEHPVATAPLASPPALPVGSPAISLRRHRREAARAAIAEVEARGFAASAMDLDLGNSPPVPSPGPIRAPPPPSEVHPPFRPAAFGALRVTKGGPGMVKPRLAGRAMLLTPVPKGRPSSLACMPPQRLANRF